MAARTGSAREVLLPECGIGARSDTDHEVDRRVYGNRRLCHQFQHFRRICKTFIRRFDPDSRLQLSIPAITADATVILSVASMAAAVQRFAIGISGHLVDSANRHVHTRITLKMIVRLRRRHYSARSAATGSTRQARRAGR
jgi:hypothetical protein